MTLVVHECHFNNFPYSYLGFLTETQVCRPKRFASLRLNLSVDTNATHSPKTKKVECIADAPPFRVNTMCQLP